MREYIIIIIIIIIRDNILYDVILLYYNIMSIVHDRSVKELCVWIEMNTFLAFFFPPPSIGPLGPRSTLCSLVHGHYTYLTFSTSPPRRWDVRGTWAAAAPNPLYPYVYRVKTSGGYRDNYIIIIIYACVRAIVAQYISTRLFEL